MRRDREARRTCAAVSLFPAGAHAGRARAHTHKSRLEADTKTPTSLVFPVAARLVRPRHARAHADVKARHARRAAGILVFRRTPTPASAARMISLTVQPRIQKEKWSLYWRESMMTKTEVLDPVTLKVDAAKETIEAVLAKLATQMHWQPASDLLRLEGFEEPWELAVFKGKECLGSSTLADCGITGDETITAVRKVLVAEGE